MGSRDWDRPETKNITVSNSLNHPGWPMFAGGLLCSECFNKGLHLGGAGDREAAPERLLLGQFRIRSVVNVINRVVCDMAVRRLGVTPRIIHNRQTLVRCALKRPFGHVACPEISQSMADGGIAILPVGPNRLKTASNSHCGAMSTSIRDGQPPAESHRSPRGCCTAAMSVCGLIGATWTRSPNACYCATRCISPFSRNEQASFYCRDRSLKILR